MHNGEALEEQGIGCWLVGMILIIWIILVRPLDVFPREYRQIVIKELSQVLRAPYERVFTVLLDDRIEFFLVEVRASSEGKWKCLYRSLAFFLLLALKIEILKGTFTEWSGDEDHGCIGRLASHGHHRADDIGDGLILHERRFVAYHEVRDFTSDVLRGIRATSVYFSPVRSLIVGKG